MMSSFISCPDKPPSVDNSGSSKFWQNPVLKGAVLLFILLGSLGVVYLSPLRDQLSHVHVMRDTVVSMGRAAPVVFMLGSALLVSIGCPRLLLCPIAGISFGFIHGFIWVQAGTILGSYATFAVVRLLGRELVLDKWPSMKRFSSVFESRGMLSVFVVRQMPVGGIYLNILLGLSSVSHRDFILGTALGILPEAVPATLLGSETVNVNADKAVFALTGAVSGLVLVWIATAWYLRSSGLPIAGIVRKISSAIKKQKQG